MATRAAIFLKLKDWDSYKSIYSHGDGFPEFTYRILTKYYISAKKADKLISGGDCAGIEEHPNFIHYYNNDDPYRDIMDKAPDSPRTTKLPSIKGIEFYSLCDFIYRGIQNETTGKIDWSWKKEGSSTWNSSLKENSKLEESMTYQDELNEILDDMKRGGYDREDMLIALQDLMGSEMSSAMEAYNDWLNDRDPKNKEITNGQIEDEFEGLIDEGFPREDILDRLEKKYKFSRSELKKILGKTIDYMDFESEDFKKDVTENLDRLQKFIADEVRRGTSIPEIIKDVNSKVFWADWMSDEEIEDMATKVKDNPYLKESKMNKMINVLNRLDEVLNRVDYDVSKATTKGNIIEDPEKGDTPALFDEENVSILLPLENARDMMGDGEVWAGVNILKVLVSAAEKASDDPQGSFFNFFKEEYDKDAEEFIDLHYEGSDVLTVKNEPRDKYISTLKQFFRTIADQLEVL